MSLKVSGLHKFFDQQEVLKGISFEAVPGKILGFLGPNGAGKSTTMKIATGFIPSSKGKVEICGYDVQANPMASRPLVGYLPEHNPLYLDMYVTEYLNFVGSLFKLDNKTIQQRTQEMIEKVGLISHRHKKIGQLSKGYRQRVGLAQAMIHQPEVLILDEPTTGLDPNQIVEIREVIKEIGKDKTVVFSTHIMQEVQQLCDQVVIIHQGEIVANESVSQLKDKNKGQKVLLLEFANSIELEKLTAFEGIQSVNALSSTRFEVSYNAKNDIRPGLFQLSTQNQWSLVGLSEKEQSLEKIFQELTQKK